MKVRYIISAQLSISINTIGATDIAIAIQNQPKIETRKVYKMGISLNAVLKYAIPCTEGHILMEKQ